MADVTNFMNYLDVYTLGNVKKAAACVQKNWFGLLYDVNASNCESLDIFKSIETMIDIKFGR